MPEQAQPEQTQPEHHVSDRERAQPTHAPSARLARALHGLLGHTHTRLPARDLTEALAYLERDVEEVRTRVNALFFAVLVSALGQLVTKVLT